VANSLSCLQYGMPYITSGFALLSKITTKPFDSARERVCRACCVV
jgi:hypothetical protein